jgi:hypothetical protein
VWTASLIHTLPRMIPVLDCVSMHINYVCGGLYGGGFQRPALIHEVPSETVRKGFEQRSEPGFGRYTGYEEGREAPSRGAAGLRSRRARGFSDSFVGAFSEVRYPQATPKQQQKSLISVVCSLLVLGTIIINTLL